MYILYSRAVYNQEQAIMGPVVYIVILWICSALQSITLFNSQQPKTKGNVEHHTEEEGRKLDYFVVKVLQPPSFRAAGLNKETGGTGPPQLLLDKLHN